MAGPGADTEAPPTLVDNVETLAHVAVALAEGADWFREVGTDESPGTMLCTVSGCVTLRGVGEFTMGTPLREIIETLGGGARPGRTIRAVLQGAASAIITADQLDTPASWEGDAGDRIRTRLVVVHRHRRRNRHRGRGRERVAFLAVESCGQCTPCKQDSLLITDALTHIAAAEEKTSTSCAGGSRRSRSARAARWPRRSKW